MPRYFFDLWNNGDAAPDHVGVDCPGDNAARDEAIKTMAQMAKDFLPSDGPQAKLRIAVREETGRNVLEVSLNFAVRAQETALL